MLLRDAGPRCPSSAAQGWWESGEALLVGAGSSTALMPRSSTRRTRPRGDAERCAGAGQDGRKDWGLRFSPSKGPQEGTTE